MLAGTDAAFSAKRRTEGERGAISDLMGDVLDGMRCLAEKVGGEGETPGGEEGHRRLTNEMGKPASKPGPGHPNGGSKTRERPGLLGIVLDEHKDASDRGIALGLIPAGRFCAGAVEPGSQSRHEHQIKEPIKDASGQVVFTHDWLLGRCRSISLGACRRQRMTRSSAVGAGAYFHIWRRTVVP